MNIRQVSEQSAEGSKQTASSCEELARMAASLQAMVSRFKV